MSKNAEQHRQRRAKHKKKGLCTECSNKAESGKRLCTYHIICEKEFKNKLRTFRKDNCLCRECGEPAINKKHCDKHRILYNKTLLPLNKERKKRNKELNKCTDCGTLLNPEMDSTYIKCLNCRIITHFPLKRTDFKF